MDKDIFASVVTTNKTISTLALPPFDSPMTRNAIAIVGLESGSLVKAFDHL